MRASITAEASTGFASESPGDIDPATWNALAWQNMCAEHQELAREIMMASRSGVQTITLKRMPKPTQRYVWELIKRWRPALAELLTSPGFTETKQRFGGKVHLLWRDVVDILAEQHRAGTH